MQGGGFFLAHRSLEAQFLAWMVGTVECSTDEVLCCFIESGKGKCCLVVRRRQEASNTMMWFVVGIESCSRNCCLSLSMCRELFTRTVLLYHSTQLAS